MIAVASGKGGVGKSTTAVNLALGLQAAGLTTGILDADIYGPSQPMMLGIAGRPESKDGKHLEPMEGHGLQAISIGFLIDVDTPMVWRGPMVTQALEQLLKDTSWRDLDYLVVDLPPGTGDIQLTLAQKVPVTGAIIRLSLFSMLVRYRPGTASKRALISCSTALGPCCESRSFLMASMRAWISFVFFSSSSCSF